MKSRIKRNVVLFTCLLFVVCSQGEAVAKTHYVRSLGDVKLVNAKAKAGDTGVIANGDWVDTEFVFQDLPGTALEPIIVRAESPGACLLHSKSSMRISGTHIIVKGLMFNNSFGRSEVFQFRTSSEKYATNSRLSDCIFVSDGNHHNENEIISNKCCDRVFRGNVFKECSGTLTLRHGKRALVEGNLFLGHAQSGTGGVRITGDGHQIINNYLEGLRDDEERAAIGVMNGEENGAANGYEPVTNLTVAHNTFADCKVTFEIGVGAGEQLMVVPANGVVKNNLMAPGKWDLVRMHVKVNGF